jgi:hypothetical protein
MTRRKPYWRLSFCRLRKSLLRDAETTGVVLRGFAAQQIASHHFYSAHAARLRPVPWQSSTRLRLKILFGKMEQPHPKVGRVDVERIVRREFPADAFSRVLRVLDEYGAEDWHREKDRVQLAVLKLAGGSEEKLRREIEGAKCDFRDVLAPAEYPAYTKKMFHIDRLPGEEQKRIIDADWKQYADWLSL